MERIRAANADIVNMFLFRAMTSLRQMAVKTLIACEEIGVWEKAVQDANRIMGIDCCYQPVTRIANGFEVAWGYITSSTNQREILHFRLLSSGSSSPNICLERRKILAESKGSGISCLVCARHCCILSQQARGPRMVRSIFILLLPTRRLLSSNIGTSEVFTRSSVILINISAIHSKPVHADQPRLRAPHNRLSAGR